MTRNRILFLFLLIGGIVVLLASCFVGIRRGDRGTGSDGLVFHGADIRDETLLPPKVRKDLPVFPGTVRTLCVRFRYETLDNGCMAQVLWLHGGVIIRREEIVLAHGEGTKCLCLSFRDGIPLPAGGYEARIVTSTGTRWSESFIVSGDV